MTDQEKIIQFLLEAARLNDVQREIMCLSGNRRESVAEHSYHLVLMAVLLLEGSMPAENLIELIKHCLLHDIGEIGAGDVNFDHHTQEHTSREVKSALDMFAILPDNKAADFSSLYYEMQKQWSVSAHYAKALDKLQPVILTLQRIKNNSAPIYFRRTSVYSIKTKLGEPIARVFPSFYPLVQELIELSLEQRLIDNV